jgi:glycosyltransferase involved in cell wall biosynthesis
LNTRPHLIHVFSTFATGGAQMRFVEIANRLGGRYRHSVVSLDGVTTAAERIEARVPLEILAAPVTKGELLRNLRRIRRWLDRRRPDAMLTYNWGSIEWAIANRVASLARHIHVEDGFGPDEATVQLPRRVWTRRLALGRSVVVLPSLTLMDIARDAWRLPSDRLCYIPNGIDVSRFHPASRDHRQPPVIGTLATLRAEKNIPRLLRAFHRLDGPVSLRVIGGGPLLESLRAEAALLDPRIECPGPITDPAAALATLDIFALSSDTEQMPLSILEAMAAGLPVVATDVGDVKAMLSQENQPFVTPRSDEPAFSAALGRLAGDRALCRALGEANRRHVARTYTFDGMVDAWDAVFRGDRVSGGLSN